MEDRLVKRIPLAELSPMEEVVRSGLAHSAADSIVEEGM
jgi:hypothetical protein